MVKLTRESTRTPNGLHHRHRARSPAPAASHRAGRAGPWAHVAQPARGRGRRARRHGDRRGLPRPRRGAARRARSPWPRARRTPPGPPCTSRWSRAPTPAARRRARRPSSSPASPAWWWPPTTRPPRPRAAGLGILRDEGVAVELVDGDVGRGRPADQPALPQARAHGPAAAWCSSRRCRWTARWPPRAATRSGSRASPAARARTAGAPSATRWPWASAPPAPTTRC